MAVQFTTVNILYLYSTIVNYNSNTDCAVYFTLFLLENESS